MPLLNRKRSDQALEAVTQKVAELEELLRDIAAGLTSKLEAIAESIESHVADEEVESTAAERIRSGAAGRTEDGAEALRELGIHPS
jgi:Mn-containing catalase